jgi:hypothetical protein
VRLATRLGEHAVNLTSAVGLVIEEVHDQERPRPRQVALGCAGILGEVAFQPSRVEPVGPCEDGGIKGGALALQVAPVLMERDGLRNAALGPWRSSEPAHPHPVGPQQMIQGCLDRAEKGPALSQPVLRQPVRDGVEVFVLPLIVAGHALHITNANYGSPPPTR